MTCTGGPVSRRRRGRGPDEAVFRARPHTYTVINTNSPLVLDIPMCQGLIDFAAAGQICIITPFTLAGANIVIHAAGWLEGGLSASYEKFILDIEQLQHMAKLMQPVRWDADELALDVMREVGPGGHFFGTRQTM